MSDLLRPENSPASPLQPIAMETPAKPGDVEGSGGSTLATHAPRPLELSRGRFLYSKITLAAESFPTLKRAGSSLLLLLWLAMHASQDGLVCAGAPVPLQMIAGELGSSRSAVKVNLGRLRRAGLVQTTATRQGLVLRLKQPENSPILIKEPGTKQTGTPGGQAAPGQLSSPSITTGQAPGQKTSPRPNRLSLVENLYREFCASHGIAPRLSRRERESLFFFLQRRPRLTSGELARAFQSFCGMVEPESVTLSGFVEESERELAAGPGGSGQSGPSLRESEEGVRP